MKKLNKKGFTLIELLAVIVIMGILMMVAIPAMQKYIDNSRKDTFADTAKQYGNAVKNLVLSNSLKCGASEASAVDVEAVEGNKYYYLPIDSDATRNALVSTGDKSPWGSTISGYVVWHIEADGSSNNYSVHLSDDGKHGMKGDAVINEIKRDSIFSADAEKSVKPGNADAVACYIK